MVVSVPVHLRDSAADGGWGGGGVAATAALAQPREGVPYHVPLAWGKIQIQNSKMASSECVSFLHRCEVEPL